MAEYAAASRLRHDIARGPRGERWKVKIVEGGNRKKMTGDDIDSGCETGTARVGDVSSNL